jgi:hypothetical protein
VLIAQLEDEMFVAFLFYCLIMVQFIEESPDYECQCIFYNSEATRFAACLQKIKNHTILPIA